VSETHKKLLPVWVVHIKSKEQSNEPCLPLERLHWFSIVHLAPLTFPFPGLADFEAERKSDRSNSVSSGTTLTSILQRKEIGSLKKHNHNTFITLKN
jgi:hypothetical protein